MSLCTGIPYTRPPPRMSEHFSDRLYRLARPVWEAQHAHPFVRGIGDGTLDVEKFKFWVRQDYLFLIDYARLLSMAVVKTPDLPTMRRFAALVQSTLDVEMELHRAYAAELASLCTSWRRRPRRPRRRRTRTSSYEP